jgi:hypothetical protein
MVLNTHKGTTFKTGREGRNVFVAKVYKTQIIVLIEATNKLFGTFLLQLEEELLIIIFYLNDKEAKRTNNDLRNITQKTKDRATRTSLKSKAVKKAIT